MTLELNISIAQQKAYIKRDDYKNTAEYDPPLNSFMDTPHKYVLL